MTASYCFNFPLQVWDDKLAKVASDYANGCAFMHNSGRTSEYGAGPKEYVGENLFFTSDLKFDKFTSVVDAWDGEKKDFNYPANTCAAGKMCGHYTQVSLLC